MYEFMNSHVRLIFLNKNKSFMKNTILKKSLQENRGFREMVTRISATRGCNDCIGQL